MLMPRLPLLQILKWQMAPAHRKILECSHALGSEQGWFVKMTCRAEKSQAIILKHRTKSRIQGSCLQLVSIIHGIHYACTRTCASRWKTMLHGTRLCDTWFFNSHQNTSWAIFFIFISHSLTESIAAIPAQVAKTNETHYISLLNDTYLLRWRTHFSHTWHLACKMTAFYWWADSWLNLYLGQSVGVPCSGHTRDSSKLGVRNLFIEYDMSNICFVLI